MLRFRQFWGDNFKCMLGLKYEFAWVSPHLCVIYGVCFEYFLHKMSPSPWPQLTQAYILKNCLKFSIFQHKNGQKFAFFITSLDFFASYIQFGMCSAEKRHSLSLGTWNFHFSVVLYLRQILLVFWSLKNQHSHRLTIFAYTTRQKVLPHPTVGAPSASNSPSARKTNGVKSTNIQLNSKSRWDEVVLTFIPARMLVMKVISVNFVPNVNFLLSCIKSDPGEYFSREPVRIHEMVTEHY